MANADISLLFGVLGEGSLSGDSGKLIQTQLTQIMAELNKTPLKVKVGIDTASGGGRSWSGQLQQKLDQISASGKFSAQISTLKLSPGAVSDFKKQLAAVVNTVGLSTGTQITISAAGIGEIKSKLKDAQDAIKKTGTDADEASKKIAEFKVQMEALGGQKNTVKKSIDALGKSATTEEEKAQVAEISARYEKWAIEIEKVRAAKKAIPADQRAAIEAEGAAILTNIDRINTERATREAAAKREPIYRGDHLNRTITYLIPMTVGNIDMERATVYLSYIRADGTADIALLVREDEPYNDRYYKYHLPITCTLSRYAGEICTFLQIFSGPPRHPTIAKSSECFLQVVDSKNMDEYITDRNLRLIYEMQRYMEDKVEKAEKELHERIDKTDEVVAAKADNIVFNEEDSTIQLVSTIPVLDEEGNIVDTTQVPLGDPIFVRADTARGIINMEINEDGDLIVTFDDEETQNLGKVVGKDGSVYVPHVDAHKVLTFTVETEPGEVPEPVDLNPNDEWGDIGEGGMDFPGVETGYVWEDM